MAESPMKDHPLGLAARYNDADAEETSLEAAIERQGLSLEDVYYLAEQRAIRCAVIQSGPRRWAMFQQAYAHNRPTPFHLTMEEHRTVQALIPAYLDGILIGWRGARIEKGDEGASIEGND